MEDDHSFWTSKLGRRWLEKNPDTTELAKKQLYNHPDYAFYDALAPELHDQGILIEPDSREPWFLCEAHSVDCLDETLDKFERAVDITMNKLAPKARLAQK